METRSPTILSPMSTPSDSPSPSPMSPLSGAPTPSTPATGAPKPAFKVTRSPFAPKITGTVAAPATTAPTGSISGPMSIGTTSALGSGLPTPGMTRKTVSARAARNEDTSPALVVLDLIAAGVAIAAAVLIGLAYYQH